MVILPKISLNLLILIHEKWKIILLTLSTEMFKPIIIKYLFLAGEKP